MDLTMVKMTEEGFELHKLAAFRRGKRHERARLRVALMKAIESLTDPEDGETWPPEPHSSEDMKP